MNGGTNWTFVNIAVPAGTYIAIGEARTDYSISGGRGFATVTGGYSNQMNHISSGGGLAFTVMGICKLSSQGNIWMNVLAESQTIQNLMGKLQTIRIK